MISTSYSALEFFEVLRFWLSDNYLVNINRQRSVADVNSQASKNRYHEGSMWFVSSSGFGKEWWKWWWEEWISVSNVQITPELVYLMSLTALKFFKQNKNSSINHYTQLKIIWYFEWILIACLKCIKDEDFWVANTKCFCLQNLFNCINDRFFVFFSWEYKFLALDLQWNYLKNKKCHNIITLNFY